MSEHDPNLWIICWSGYTMVRYFSDNGVTQNEFLVENVTKSWCTFIRHVIFLLFDISVFIMMCVYYWQVTHTPAVENDVNGSLFGMTWVMFLVHIYNWWAKLFSAHGTKGILKYYGKPIYDKKDVTLIIDYKDKRTKQLQGYELVRPPANLHVVGYGGSFVANTEDIDEEFVMDYSNASWVNILAWVTIIGWSCWCWVFQFHALPSYPTQTMFQRNQIATIPYIVALFVTMAVYLLIYKAKSLRFIFLDRAATWGVSQHVTKPNQDNAVHVRTIFFLFPEPMIYAFNLYFFSSLLEAYRGYGQMLLAMWMVFFLPWMITSAHRTVAAWYDAFVHCTFCYLQAYWFFPAMRQVQLTSMNAYDAGSNRILMMPMDYNVTNMGFTQNPNFMNAAFYTVDPLCCAYCIVAVFCYFFPDDFIMDPPTYFTQMVFKELRNRRSGLEKNKYVKEIVSGANNTFNSMAKGMSDAANKVFGV